MLPISWSRPAVVVGLGYAVVVLLLLATHDWDPRFFATVGPQWARHDPHGLKAGDGAAFFALADDPARGAGRWGAYRAERLLYPLVARAAALGQRDLVPWMLLLVNWAAIALGTEIVHRLLARAGAPVWMALAYGAWGGQGLALLKDTAEPVTYFFALLGIWCWERGRRTPAMGAFLCALMGRETALFTVAPFLFLPARAGGGGRRWLLSGFAVIALWQAWVLGIRLWLHGSAAPRAWFWLIPLVGFGSTRLPDLPLTVITLILPALAVLTLGLRGLGRTPGDPRLWSAVLNAVLVLGLPASTADVLWHSGRLATGLVAATLVATPLGHLAPRVWTALALVFISSASWTLVATVRYLFWDTVILGSLM